MEEVTKDDYLKAIQIVNDYNQKLKEQIHTETKCICCKDKIIKPMNINYFDKDDLSKHDMWKDGTVENISFGYGSNHDCKTYKIAICDDCIDDLLKENIIQDVKDINKIIYGKTH